MTDEWKAVVEDRNRMRKALLVIVRVAALHGEKRILDEANFALDRTQSEDRKQRPQ